MLISNKYIYLATGSSYLEQPPKIYVDWFYLKPNLKRNWSGCKTFQWEIGFFGICLTGSFHWGHIVRERTKEEEEEHQRIQKFIGEVFKDEK